ncbi:uncharacterized protein B0T15DRAFT_548164 [Chaetomium strumarium]|uniref:Uncharacterized protein n=1 Tax=Chaetomium strumarium TaxID=1170767 RepID=A0AAJ0H389_9PEZI|nr:hypothetical protein B0T15DRAFT_548164 [Chaetomium strumarium]
MSPDEVARLPPLTDIKPDTLFVLRFTLKDGEVPQVESYGLPTVCEVRDQVIFDGGAEIDGVMSLRELCHQRRFKVISAHCGMFLPSINKNLEDHFGTIPQRLYPCTIGVWDFLAYKDQLARKECIRSEPYETVYKFGSHEDCAIAISQGVVQDAFHFIKDVQEIRESKVECVFLTDPDSDGDPKTAGAGSAKQPGHMPSGHMAKYGNTLKRLLKGDAQFELAFELPPSKKSRDFKVWKARQISAEPCKETRCDFAMRIRRPRRGERGENMRNVDLGWKVSVTYSKVNKS